MVRKFSRYSLRHPDEKLLDFSVYKLCRAVNDSSAFPSLVKRTLQNILLQTHPEFYWNGKILNPTRMFDDIIHTFWLPAARDIMDEIWTLGVVAIRLSKIKPGKSDRIPVVMKNGMGTDYIITVLRDQSSGRMIYRYYRLKTKDGQKILNEPVEDKNVHVLSGFGSDPLPSGKLTSAVATILDYEQYHALNYRFSLTALFNMSRPMLITEPAKDAAGVLTQDDMIDYYGGQDAIRERDQLAYELNESEIQHLNEQNRDYFENFYKDQEPHTNALVPQAKRNIMPLPVGHRLVQQPTPSMRSDWREMNEIYQEIVSSAYGVPRANIMTTHGMTQSASTELASKTLAITTNNWKRRLGKIFTDVYCLLYNLEDCKFAMGQYTTTEIKEMTKNELFEKTHKQRVTVGFPVIPHDTMDGLIQKFALGLMDWNGFVQSSRALMGYSSTEFGESGTPEDPWNQEAKLRMFHAQSKSALSPLGGIESVVFSTPEQLSTQEETQGTKRKDIQDDDESKLETQKKKKRKKDEKIADDQRVG